MIGMLDGKVAIVHGGGVAGAMLAEGLAAAGAEVAISAASGDLGGLAAEFAEIAGWLGGVDLVVVPVVDPDGLAPRPFADLDEADWRRLCEEPLRAVRIALQAAHGVLADRGGRIVLLIPTIALSGAEGLAPYSAAAEGAHALAKTAARQWGARGITVNCLGLPAELLCRNMQGHGLATRSPQALGRSPDLATEVAAVVAHLVIAPGIVTGATIMLDGGTLMAG